MIRLHTSDGVDLDADLAVADQPWAGAVVCHPHPAYGGTRHNVVVDRVFQTLADAGITALRFDFRHDGAGAEQDVLTALGHLAHKLTPSNRCGWSATRSEPTSPSASATSDWPGGSR